MTAYTTQARAVTEDGHHFDSILERDWAGFIAHIGLRWRREPFAIRKNETGPTTLLNIVGRPDFFLPDLPVIFECKPSVDLVIQNSEHWWEEADRVGLPVVVTEGRPQPQWLRSDMDLVTSGRSLGFRDPEAFAGSHIEINHPPTLWIFGVDRSCEPGYFARCPDCVSSGLVSPHGRMWLSACRHPAPSKQALMDALKTMPRVWETRGMSA